LKKTVPVGAPPLKNFRFGFQGQEGDDEIKGDGNSVNYTFRMHDPRLGRFFAVDPLASKYPANSVYAFSENKVIHMVELEGLESAPSGSNSSTEVSPSSSGGTSNTNAAESTPPPMTTPSALPPIKSSYIRIAPLNYGFSLIIGNEPMMVMPKAGADPSSGTTLGKGLGAEHYGTITKYPFSLKLQGEGKNDASETNHQFGFERTFMNGFTLEALYSKQKIRGNNPNGYNLEAPGSINLNATARFSGPREIIGVSPGIGAGATSGTLRTPGWHSSWKLIGQSATAFIKVDANIVGNMSFYARVAVTGYHINAQETPIGDQDERGYVIIAGTAGLIIPLSTTIKKR
jgi:RHS repeat-associated protein